MNLSLSQFQDAFVEALYQRSAPELETLTGQAAFSVYRNTVLKGCVDALCDNYPSIERLVGTPWMRAAAAEYALHSPPTDARLVRYGAAFPAFLEDLETARELPYLADVARLDHDWLEVFCAPDEPRLELTSLTGMTAADLGRLCLRPRIATRWRWFGAQPIYSLWRYSREGLDWSDELPWVGEGALLVGGSSGVDWLSLEEGGCVFLDACAAGHDLDYASSLALQAQPDLDFTDLLGRLLHAGVFRPFCLDCIRLD